MSESTVFKPLHLAERLTAALDTHITYAYDDLAFVDRMHTLLQFPGPGIDELYLYLNEELNGDGRDSVRKRYEAAAAIEGIPLTYRGLFSLMQVEGADEVAIRLQPCEQSEA